MSNKIQTQADFYNEVSQLVQSQMSLRENQPFEYEEPHPKVSNKFNYSVASLGDIYNKLNKGNNDYLELLDGTTIIPSIETKGIQRDPNTGRPCSSIALQNKGDMTTIVLDPSSISQSTKDDFLRKTRVKDVNYLHMAQLEESKKYSHVVNGVINPPQSNFSVKNIIVNNIKNHEREMNKVIVYPNRVRIHHIQPSKRTRGQSIQRASSPNNDNDANNHLMVIGKSVNMNQINDTHVQFTKPKEVRFKPRALSSKTARKTLLVSEKFVGAVDNYFNSSEMKIPSKNDINQIVNYAQDVEKYLNKYVKEMNINHQGKPNKKYEDPFRKKLKNQTRTAADLPPKIYPVIENDYQRKVEEKLSRLQVELRVIFDTLSQQSEVKHGDDEKINKMITKAKELTKLIKHLAGDVNRSREVSLNRIKEEKQKFKEDKDKGKDKTLIKHKSASQVNIRQGAKNVMSQLNTINQFKSSIASIKNNDSIKLSPQSKSGNDNKVIVSAINPVQESLIGASILKESNQLVNQQSMAQSIINKQSSQFSFGNDTIKEEKTLQASQSQPHSLYHYSSSFRPNPLHQSLVDPNITLNDFQVEASKIKVDPIQAIRDERFSSFNIEMPVQYYYQVSKDHEPNPEKEWFIRPHHIETFSKSNNAIPDDVLNTKYISYIGEVEKKDTKSRQQMLEEMLAETRGHINSLQFDLFAKCQTDKEKERLYERLEAIKEEAKKDYVPGHIIDKKKKNEKISDRLTSGEPKSFTEMFDGNEQIHQTNFAIDTFSKLLLEIRNKEQELLNIKRKEEYERIRPPMKNWYELKGTEFQTEIKRNKMVINANPEYFEKIKQLTNTELY